MTPPPPPAKSSGSRTAFLAVLFTAALLSGAHMVNRGVTQSAMTTVNGAQLFESVRTLIAHDYVDTLSDSIMYRMAVQGLMAELNDPADAFLTRLRTPAVTTPNSIRSTTRLPNAVTYVQIGPITDSTPRQLTAAIESLLHTGTHAIILDTRSDSTDSLPPAVALANLFLNPGQEAAHTRGRLPNSTRAYVDQTPQRWPTIPLAILVDQQTSGSAELFAGALQDHDRAVIIGAPTAGRGSTQTLYPLDSTAIVRLTTARWYTPSGRVISRGAPSTDDLDEDNTPKKPTYRTDSGRLLIGGGGIMPDVVIGDTTVHLKFQAPHHHLPPNSTPVSQPDSILIAAQTILAGIHTQPEAITRAAQLAATHHLTQ